jgi:hypothetical protein
VNSLRRTRAQQDPVGEEERDENADREHENTAARERQLGHVVNGGNRIATRV